MLARTHGMLQPVRAWCEWRRVPYRLVENGKSRGQPELHQTREGQALIHLLRGRRHTLIRSGALNRWIQHHREPDNL